MLSLGIPSIQSKYSDPEYKAPEHKLVLGGNATLSSNFLHDLLKEKDAQYLHFTSSACLSGMNHPDIPEEERGFLLPGGKLNEYNIKLKSGEGGEIGKSHIKYGSVSVFHSINLEDTFSSIGLYMCEEFMGGKDYFPVIFAIQNHSDITSPEKASQYSVVDPPQKMDQCEFAIRGGVQRESIKAIIVPTEFVLEAKETLTQIPMLGRTVIAMQ